MDKKAIIYDFDNTMYSVKSIGEELFSSLFDLIESTGEHNQNMNDIRKDLMGEPFQVVAEKYRFSDELKQQCTQLLRTLTYKGEIRPFEDYEEIMRIPGDRYLVTTGFSGLQWSKIRRMGIEGDFHEIHVVDPDTSIRTKKDVFADIIQRKGYPVSAVLVVGDDPDSEIGAAKELGIDTALIDKDDQHSDKEATFRVDNFVALKEKLKEWVR